jgi:hypothetical protein
MARLSRADDLVAHQLLGDEALRQARPLPSDAEMAIEGLTDEEWIAFEQALIER